MAPAFCIECGAELQGDHRFCPRCGKERWAPGQEASPSRPPPGAGSQTFAPRPAAPVASPRLRWLPFLFAAGAVFWLVQLVQFAATMAAPAGRDQLHQAMVQAGLTGDLSTLLAVEAGLVFFFEGTAAALHATAYFGLRARKTWGWIAGVIVAAAWSLLLIGIPVLVLMLRRTTRQAYGITA